MQQHIDQDDVLIIAALEHYRTSINHDIMNEHCSALATELADRNGISIDNAEAFLTYDI